MAPRPHRTLLLGLCSQVLSQGPLPVAHSQVPEYSPKHLSPLLPEAELIGSQDVEWHERQMSPETERKSPRVTQPEPYPCSALPVELCPQCHAWSGVGFVQCGMLVWGTGKDGTGSHSGWWLSHCLAVEVSCGLAVGPIWRAQFVLTLLRCGRARHRGSTAQLRSPWQKKRHNRWLDATPRAGEPLSGQT